MIRTNPIHLKEWQYKGLRKRWEDREIAVTQWFERDRAHVAIQEVQTGDILAGWWDEEVGELVEDGFFKTARIPFSRKPIDEESVIAYAEYIGVSAYPSKEKYRENLWPTFWPHPEGDRTAIFDSPFMSIATLAQEALSTEGIESDVQIHPGTGTVAVYVQRSDAPRAAGILRQRGFYREA